MIHIDRHGKNRAPLLIFVLALVLVVGACAQPDSAHDAHAHHGYAEPDTFEFASVEDLKRFFAEAGYDIDHWNQGERSIPRYFLASVPSRWRNEVASELPVDLKKRYFFFTYAPLVLESNADIAADRQRILALQEAGSASPDDTSWLGTTAERYGVEIPVEGFPTGEQFSDLLGRVDTIPPSLALAQAAVESAWSTSRFADVGNALFGQWTWDDDGITPAEQRDNLGNYKIRAFDSPEASIAAYMHNLNTHRAYADFRQERAHLRNGDKKLSGHHLASTLTSYSEKGEEYVEILQTVMRVNNLAHVDEAYLRDMRPVLLVPVGEGSD